MTTTWITPANDSIYDHEASFKKNGYIDWSQSKPISSIAVGDELLIYCSGSKKEIQYRCKIEKVNMSYEEATDDTEFWKSGVRPVGDLYYRARLEQKVDELGLTYRALQKHGLRYNFAGPVKLSSLGGEVESYVLFCLKYSEPRDDEMTGYPEGAKDTITVNRYERDPRNRRACIDHYGCRCQACDMDFGEIYGPNAKGFIHVHHVVPVSELGEDYHVNPVKDLVPLCPNCHAMVHHLKLSVEELRILLKQNPGE